MKNLNEIKNILSHHKDEIEQKYEVKEIGIFGSYVRGEEIEASDLDILVELGKAIGLIKFIEIEEYLSELLGVKVDLVMKGALKPRIGKRILREVVYV